MPKIATFIDNSIIHYRIHFLLPSLKWSAAGKTVSSYLMRYRLTEFFSSPKTLNSSVFTTPKRSAKGYSV